MPKTKKPILIAIPHCSTFVPAEIRKHMALSDFKVREETDLYTDEIFDVKNAYIVKAKIARVVVDPNRAPDHIEHEWQLNEDGVVISITGDGKPIYDSPPSIDTIFERVEKYHNGFHEEVEALYPKVKFLIDAHSMFSKGQSTKADAGKERAEIVLGNRDYTTCSRELTIEVKRFFEEKGLSVKVNNPYSGKYVIGYHCSRDGLPGLQIEINRKLYMNEKTLHPHKRNIEKLNGFIEELVEKLSELVEKDEERRKKKAKRKLS